MNRRSSLDTLRFFDVTSGALIPDIMHDILEGALPMEVKLMLRVSFIVTIHLYMFFKYAYIAYENVRQIHFDELLNNTIMFN